MFIYSDMAEHDRLERLVAAEGEDTLEERLAALDDLEDEASRGLDADLDVLGALAGETRYFLVRLLVAADRELTVGELDAVVGVSQSAISHALGELSAAGLVERRRKGTWRYYRPTDRVERLVAVLGAIRE